MDGGFDIIGSIYEKEVTSNNNPETKLRLGVRGDFNFPIYKMIKKCYADNFFKRGELRIGTLYDFINEERYGKFIGDQMEGTFQYLSMDQMTREYDDFFGKPIGVQVSSCNGFIFCCSNTFSDELLKEFEADTVIKINSVGFFEELSKILIEEVSFGVIGRMNYYSNIEIKDLIRSSVRINPENGLVETHKTKFPRVSFVKGEKYKSQGEIRAMWEAKCDPSLINSSHNSKSGGYMKVWSNEIDRKIHLEERGVRGDLEPRVIFAPEAVKYCEIVHHIDRK